MQVGLILPNILSPVNDRDTIVAAAKLAEDSGYESIWACDHVLMPAENVAYGSGTEIIVTLAYLAAITERVELGTGIILLPLRNPLVVAKQFATLDAFSDGRTIFGIGVGWNKPEYQFLNADFHQRGKLADEYIDIVYKLWTEDDPSHVGTHTFDDVLFAPKPKRRPPLYIGGSSDAAIKRAARVGDAWQPNGPIENLAERVALLREHAGDREVAVSMAIRVDMREGAASVVDMLASQGEMGLTYPTIRFWHETQADLLAQIEAFAAEVIPQIRE